MLDSNISRNPDPNYGTDQTYEYLFTPDGESLSSGGYDTTVKIIDVVGGSIAGGPSIC